MRKHLSLSESVKTKDGTATVTIEKRGSSWIVEAEEPGGKIVKGSSPDSATLSVHNVRYPEIDTAIAELIEELR